MATSQADMILERLRKLSEEEWSLEQRYRFLREPLYRSYLPELSFAETVLLKHTQARKSSAKLLYDLIHSSKSRQSSPRVRFHSHRPQAKAMSPGWWAWLERLEGELEEQNMWLTRTRTHHIRKQNRTEKQLATWKEQQDRRQVHSMEALKLVLKFKAKEHARILELQNDCLARITGLSFPRELLTQVVEATIESQVPYWHIDQLTSRANVADEAFGKWPESFGSNLRCLIRKISARAMLEHSLIIIPAIFNLQYTLAIPPKFQGCEHRIRYLALDLSTTPHDGAHNRELSRCSQSMASLKSLFPTLESCVISIRLVHNTGHLTRFDLPTDALGRPTFVVPTLNYRNIKSIGKVITLEEAFIDFIASFLRHGPGKRRFIRFIHGSVQNTTLKRIGPLVDVSVQVPIISGPSMETLTLEEDRFSTDARRIFQEAYWGKGGRLRGDWNKAFREG